MQCIYDLGFKSVVFYLSTSINYQKINDIKVIIQRDLTNFLQIKKKLLMLLLLL